MDVSIILTLAQTLLQLLDSSIVRELEIIGSFRSQLAKLKDTMSTICAELLDAEELERLQVQCSNVDSDWLDKLRDAVYLADDLFDEVATIAQQRRLMGGNKFSKEVSLFFSLSNQLAFAFNISRETKKIRERLDNIAKDHRDFGSSSKSRRVSVEGSIIRKRREESHSSVCDEDVIGRDGDKRVVIEMLLDSSVNNDVSFITIVGIGGLGKTTLAQLVYNDERVSKGCDIKLWVCVSEEFDIKALICKVLESATNRKHGDLGLDQLRSQLRQAIDGKKYLLILDDMWNENRHEWLKLREMLIGGGQGSRIVVTSRSKMVAKTIGNNVTYELKGLSEKDSWHLFKRMAIEESQDIIDADLVEIGKDILQKCANVPLAIRVVGSLLFGQGKSRWVSLKNIDLVNITQGENGILPILKLSYYHLTPPLKRCFNYCAVFPKNYTIKKEILISLWMAHGFIVPVHGQSLEDAGEEYFMNLLQRCFFQDVKRDDNDEILSCKLHDLMHDVATEVAGSEIAIANSITRHFHEKIRHLSVENYEGPSILSSLAKMKSLRTFLKLHSKNSIYQSSITGVILSNLRCLRALDLQWSSIKRLSSTIEKLLHLRYLDLSFNYDLEMLPASLAILQNLQTLRLVSCRGLKALPTNFTKLVNLRHLDMSGCDSLSSMPPGMNKLTCLHKLTMFVVTGASCACSYKEDCVGQLDDLRALTELKGGLTIRVLNVSIPDVGKVREARYLLNMEHLKDLCIQWAYVEDKREDDDVANNEALLEGLQPHPNIRSFELQSYAGVRFPSWASLNNLGTSLTNLVKIIIVDCPRLQHLLSLSQLSHLKSLSLYWLENLEYIESSDSSYSASVSVNSIAADKLLFFPSLEKLELEHLPKLKGWWRLGIGAEMEADHCYQQVVDRICDQQQFSSPLNLFPSLSKLQIWKCPKLLYIPICSHMEELHLFGYKEILTPGVSMEEADTHLSSSSSSFLSSSSSPSTSSSSSSSASLFFHTSHLQQQEHANCNLKRLRVDNVGYLNSLPMESFQHLSSLDIHEFDLECLSSAEDVFRLHLSCLQSLKITACNKLSSLSGGGLEHLTALEELTLWDLPVLDLNARTTEEDEGMPWKSLQSLRSLEIGFLPKLVKMPNGLQYLTCLQSLSILYCHSLEALPEWISCLASLQSLHITCSKGLETFPEAMCKLVSLRRLEIQGCPDGLRKRCQKPNGIDWPKLQHIQHVLID